jgi:hypothetical protein
MAMPYRKCPICRNPGRLITESTDKGLEYYRCDRCGQAWVHDKADPTQKPRPVSYVPGQQ